MIRLNLLPPEDQGRARGPSKWTTAQGDGPRDSTAPVVWIAVVPAFALAVGVFGHFYHGDIMEPENRRDEAQSVLETLQGEVADPANPPSGCYFHPRCPFAKDICRTTEPPLVQTSPEHLARCHFAAELNLPGVPA